MSRRLKKFLTVAFVLGLVSTGRGAIFDLVTTAPESPPRLTYGLVASPDGQHIYTTNTEDGIAVYRWNAILERIEYAGLEPVADVNFDLAISPDGAHVYVATSTGSLRRIRVLSRDVSTGELTEIQVASAVTSGGTIRDIEFNADGTQVFASQDSTVTVFTRDVATGLLTPLQTLVDGEAGIVGLGAPRSLTASSDGLHVYVGTSGDDAILTFDRDPVTGLLTYVDTLYDTLLAAPIDMRLSSDGEFLYVADAAGIQVMIVFDRDPATGALSLLESHPLQAPITLAMSPAEDFLYAGELSGGVATFSRNAITGSLTSVDNEPIGKVQNISITADGANLFTHSDAVVALKRDAVTGEVEVRHVLPGADNALETLVSPDLSFVYTIDGTSILTFSRDPATEEMTLVGGAQNELFGAELNNTAAGVLSSDGRHLYTSGVDTLTVFERDAVTGGLTALETHVDDEGGTDGLRTATSLHLSPDQRHLYVGSEGDDAIAVFARDVVTGLLTFVEAEPLIAHGLARPRSPVLSPDGLHLYVAARDSDALAVYSRDAATGALDFLEAYVDGQGGLQHLDATQGVAVSPDGRHVYATSLGDQALVAFDRDPATGTLTLLEVVEGSTAPETHLFTQSVSVALDGSLLFAGGQSVFRRHTNGRVSWIHDLSDGGTLIRQRTDGAIYSFRFRRPSLLDVGFRCAALPVAPCHQAQKSKLAMRDRTPDLKDSLRWTWAKGDAMTIEEIAPNDGNDFALCFYDESASTPTLLYEALAPADQFCTTAGQSNPKECWTANSKIVKYLDRILSPDGLESIKLVPKLQPKSQMKVKGKGVALDLPPAPLNLPLRTQLQSRTGTCWESEFTSAKKNEAGSFSAVAP